MSDDWSVIKQEVSTYRKYVAGLPKVAADAASYCFLLTKEEIDRLLALRGHDGTPLDGVRIYLAGKKMEGHLVPTVHVVAVEKEGEVYNDFNVPKEMPATTKVPGTFGASAPGTGSTGNLPPCPNFCSGKNILNS
jgi:hypothetical protein